MPSGYSAAREAVARVLPHLAGSHTASDPVVFESIIDAAFWASLRREEGYAPRISLAMVTPEEVSRPLSFERPIPLLPASLTKLAPAVERPGVHLGVCVNSGGSLHVWGATRNLPSFCVVLEVVAPGLLVIKQSRGEETSKFVNIAVLEADQIKIIDQHAAMVPDCPALLTSLLGLESRFAPAASMNVLIQLAVSMRAHGRGGSLLVVPSNSAEWQESILQPITYGISPAFSALADLMEIDPDERQRRWQEALRRAIDGIAGLTAVDGATVLTDRHELLAFGAKIVRRTRWPQVDRVIVTEPIEGASPNVVEPAQLGGTRHLSAAQFAHDQRNAIALVASQDGRFTVFGWSPCEEMVHGHRIESLLL